MPSTIDEPILGADGKIIGIIYKTDKTYEVYRRERVSSATPGNRHDYVGKYETLEQARNALK